MSKSKRHQKASGQRNLLIVIGVVTAIALLGGAVALLSPPAAETGYPAEISVAEAAAKRDLGVFILDVRTPAEWEEYHVPGSTLIPLDELPSRLDEVPRDQEVVVVCRSGNRSATGRDMLRQAGFTQVTSLAGGLSQWRSQGYPTVAGQ